MTLSEVYFYMILIVFQIPNLFIMTTAEDLKSKKYFLKYLKLSLLMIVTGVIMELFGWNYLSPFQCVFITSIPFLSIITIKIITIFFNLLFKKEPFQVDIYDKELSDGFWVKNRGDLNEINYYIFYSISIMIVPMVSLFTFLHILIKDCN